MASDTPSIFDYDLFVIGAGSGGVRAARVAAGEAGAKVAIAEESRYGGTCVIRGCVPKKLMVFASGYGTMAAEAQAYGWDITENGFDWGVFKPKLEAELDRLEGIYQKLLDGSDVDKFDQRATLADAHTVRLADGTTKTAKTILIATGGRPVKPEIPGAELGITSNDIFHVDELPKRILIVGGGYIGCEFAGVLNGLGCHVTQYYRGLQVLRGFDEEARTLIADEMKIAGIDLKTGIDVEKLEKTDDGILVHDTLGGTATFDQVLFATGRAPNTEGLGLEEAGVTLGKKGEVVVDEFSHTGVPSIWAIGGRDRPGAADPRRDPRRHGLRRDGVQGQPDEAGSRVDPDGDLHPARDGHHRPFRGRGAGHSEGTAGNLCHFLQADAAELRRRCGAEDPDEADRGRPQPHRSGLSHRRPLGRRDDPDGRHRRKDGGHEGRF